MACAASEELTLNDFAVRSCEAKEWHFDRESNYFVSFSIFYSSSKVGKSSKLKENVFLGQFHTCLVFPYPCSIFLWISKCKWCENKLRYHTFYIVWTAFKIALKKFCHTYYKCLHLFLLSMARKYQFWMQGTHWSFILKG